MNSLLLQTSRNLQVAWFSEACAVPQACLPSCRSGRLYLQPRATDLTRKWGVYNNSIVAVHMGNKFSKYTQEINSVMPPSPSHEEAFSSHETRTRNDSNDSFLRTNESQAISALPIPQTKLCASPKCFSLKFF